MNKKEKQIYEEELAKSKKPCPVCSRPDRGKYVYHYGECDAESNKPFNITMKKVHLINT